MKVNRYTKCLPRARKTERKSPRWSEGKRVINLIINSKN